MQKQAAKKSKLLAEKQAEADRALVAITSSMTVGNESQRTINLLVDCERAKR
jgi:hypothetical protein